jgi:hypothetical protein
VLLLPMPRILRVPTDNVGQGSIAEPVSLADAIVGEVPECDFGCPPFRLTKTLLFVARAIDSSAGWRRPNLGQACRKLLPGSNQTGSLPHNLARSRDITTFWNLISTRYRKSDDTRTKYPIVHK